MAKYWVAVASREHVKRGISGGFCQVCHGKAWPLKEMQGNDWIVYYSPTEIFGEKSPCRRFTAIGRVSNKAPYQFQMTQDFIPWRRDVIFYPATEISIEPLINALEFIQDKIHWGFPFRRGCFLVSENDFALIALHMGIEMR